MELFGKRKRRFHDVDEPAERSRKPRHDDIAGDQELELIERCKKGDRRAGETLLAAHDWFIRIMARRGRQRGLEDEDLLQVAKIGFLEGVSRFEPERGTKLITCAAWWMRHEIDTACENGQLVHVPEKMLKRVAKARRDLSKDQMIGATARPDAVEALAGEHAQAAAVAMARPMSFDAPWRGDSDEPLAAQYAGPPGVAVPTPEELYELAEADHKAKRGAAEILTVLTPWEREVVEARILTDDPETLEQIGARFERTRERVRQIEANAILKLRGAAQARRLTHLARPTRSARIAG